jgi:competence protein ComEC
MRHTHALLLILGVMVPAARLEAQVADAMRVHVIDVGQGDATLVEFPCAAMLVDTGGERSPSDQAPQPTYNSTPRLMAYLRAFFKARPHLGNRLDLLVLTHPHKDHTRGVPDVIAEFAPKSVIHNGQTQGSGSDEQAFARRYAREENVARWFVLERTIDKSKGLVNDAIDPVNCPKRDPRIVALWGQVENGADWDPEDFQDPNNHSVVLRVEYGSASVLFTGDLEEHTNPQTTSPAGLERLVAAYKDSKLLDADVYHVGHHGSHNGTTPALLAAISPQIAVMSVGPWCRNGDFTARQHRHPRAVTVTDLENAVTRSRNAKNVRVFKNFSSPATVHQVTKAIYATGWDGTIVLEGTAAGAWKVVSMSGLQACNP